MIKPMNYMYIYLCLRKNITDVKNELEIQEKKAVQAALVIRGR